MKTRERHTQTWTTQKSVQSEPRKYLTKKKKKMFKCTAEPKIYFETSF